METGDCSEWSGWSQYTLDISMQIMIILEVTWDNGVDNIQNGVMIQHHSNKYLVEKTTKWHSWGR